MWGIDSREKKSCVFRTYGVSSFLDSGYKLEGGVWASGFAL